MALADANAGRVRSLEDTAVLLHWMGYTRTVLDARTVARIEREALCKVARRLRQLQDPRPGINRL